MGDAQKHNTLFYEHNPTDPTNRLALSTLKTNFILFHSKNLKLHKSFTLKIDGANIKQVSTMCYL